MAVGVLYLVWNYYLVKSSGRFIYPFLKWNDPIESAVVVTALLGGNILVMALIHFISKRRLLANAKRRSHEKEIAIAIYGIESVSVFE